MRGRVWTSVALVLLAAGWASAAVPSAPAPAALPAAPAASSDAQFFGELAYKDVATAADTARALAILVSAGKETGADFAAAKAYLSKQGVMPDGWLDKAAADTPTDKGHLASLICRALKIQGGLGMRLFGPVPRLALRECAYLELMAMGAEYRHVTGGELAGVIDRADRWRTRHAALAAAEVKK
jgi:hypothetical protein